MTKYMHVSFITKNTKTSAITYGDALLKYHGETMAELRIKFQNELRQGGYITEDAEIPTILGMAFLSKRVYKSLQGGY